MTGYNELREGQDFYANGYKLGYTNGYKLGYADAKKDFERPHGKWVEGEIRCDQCNSEFRYSYLTNNEPDWPNFCAEYGVDMRGREVEEELWELAYKDANPFLKEGLDRMKQAGYVIQYNEDTHEFTCKPPLGGKEE